MHSILWIGLAWTNVQARVVYSRRREYIFCIGEGFHPLIVIFFVYVCRRNPLFMRGRGVDFYKGGKRWVVDGKGRVGCISDEFVKSFVVFVVFVLRPD